MDWIAQLHQYLTYQLSVPGLPAIPAYLVGLAPFLLYGGALGVRRVGLDMAIRKEQRIVRPEAVISNSTYSLSDIQWELAWAQGIRPAYVVRFVNAARRDINDNAKLVYRAIPKMPDDARTSDLCTAIVEAYSGEIPGLRVEVSAFGNRTKIHGNNRLRKLRREAKNLLRRRPGLARPVRPPTIGRAA